MFIRTICGDISPSRLGFCQPHEHLFNKRGPSCDINPDLCIDNPDLSLEELKNFFDYGGRAIVDAQPIGAGRDISVLHELSIKSKVHIIASTGYHLPFFYKSDHWVYNNALELLENCFCCEIESGSFLESNDVFPTTMLKSRAGIVKAAIGEDGCSGKLKEMLRAAGKAALRTGAPLLLHTERGIGSLEAIDFLTNLGLPSNQILICHADRQVGDHSVQKEIAKLGAYLEFDTIGRFRYHDDESEIELIRDLVESGYSKQILLSLDTTAARLASYGGNIGLTYILTTFIPKMKIAGFDNKTIDVITNQNPAQALSFHSKKENI